MHRPVGIFNPIVYKDIRAPEVRKLLGSFNRDSYVILIKNTLYALADNSILYIIELKIDCENIQNEYVAFRPEQLDSIPEDSLIIDQTTFNFVYNKISCILSMDNTYARQIANVEELRGNDEFENLIAMKSGEGMGYFKLPRLDIPGKSIMIPIFTGFPKLSKPDKIGIIVWKILEYSNELLVEFKIFKKNINRYMDMYFRILDI